MNEDKAFSPLSRNKKEEYSSQNPKNDGRVYVLDPHVVVVVVVVVRYRTSVSENDDIQYDVPILGKEKEEKPESQQQTANRVMPITCCWLVGLL